MLAVFQVAQTAYPKPPGQPLETVIANASEASGATWHH